MGAYMYMMSEAVAMRSRSLFWGTGVEVMPSIASPPPPCPALSHRQACSTCRPPAVHVRCSLQVCRSGLVAHPPHWLHASCPLPPSHHHLLTSHETHRGSLLPA